MNKKEVSEIKRLLTLDKCCITKIAGCFVDVDKNMKLKIKEPFLSLDDKERLKYIEILKAALGGRLGKNLICLEFPSEEEQQGGRQHDLRKLLDTDLDDTVLDAFYQKVIDSYSEPDNYFILVAKGAYDIPTKTSDGMRVVDASDYVYEHIFCAICPMKPSKAGLSYDDTAQDIVNTMRKLMVEKPVQAFLFPAFTDRNTNIHETLYFTKKELQTDIIEGLLGCHTPLDANRQKEIITDAVNETISCDFETAKSVCEQIHESTVEKAGEPEPYKLDAEEIQNILAAAGVEPTKIKEVSEQITNAAGKQNEIFASNVFDNKDLVIKNNYLTMKVKMEHSADVFTKVIDGAKCLVVRLNDDLDVSGFVVK